jgi:hypothetical protein
MSNEDYEQMESSARQHQDDALHITKMDNAYEIHCLEVVHALGLEPYRDGNKWCYLYGKNLQEGVCGFGSTIMSACMNFYENMNMEAGE